MGMSRAHDMDHDRAGSDDRQHGRSTGRRVWNSVLLGGLTIVLALCIGFAVFLSNIQREGAQVVTEADAIVILTGGVSRLEPANELLRQGLGKRLLVSGVNPDTTEDELASVMGIDQSLFDCCVDIDRLAMDTVGNAREIANWADAKGYTSLIVVTNDYHMPRSLLELRKVAGHLELQPYPVSNPPGEQETSAEKLDRYRVLSNEYLKYLLSQARRIASTTSA